MRVFAENVKSRAESRAFVHLSLVAVLALLACAAYSIVNPAAASATTTLGSLPSSASSGGCNTSPGCDFIQIYDPFGSYTVPTAGVITAFNIREGTVFTGTNTAKLRVYRPTGGGSWTVLGESLPTAMLPFGNYYDTMPARITVQPGDRLGLSLVVQGDSPWQHPGDPFEGVGTINLNVPVGGSFSAGDITGPGTTKLSLKARLEPDADGDGYGDETQDLCPGDSSKGATGCSGTTVGSNFLNPTVEGGNQACGAAPPPLCVILNTAVGGVATAAPANGVIVRWRLRSTAGDADIALKVLHAETPTSWRVTGTSDPLQQRVTSLPVMQANTRIPIQFGDHIGLVSSTAQHHAFYMRPGAGDVGYMNPAPADGAAAPPFLNVYSNGDLLYNADVEADTDADGFGDQTQDGCPTDAAEQGACPKPVISGFKSKRKKFRVDPKGSVIRASAAKGTTISLSLSKASSVQYVVSMKLKGKRKGRSCVKRTAKNRRAKNCTYFSVVHFFKQDLAAGTSSFKYSGRYARGRRVKQLKPGTYRVTAVPTSTASAVIGDATSLGFRVIAR